MAHIEKSGERAEESSPPSSPSADGQEPDEEVGAFAAFGQALQDRATDSLNLVLLTRDRIQETLDDAVARGHLTRDAANNLVAELVHRSTEQVDRARRVVGVGPAFPIENYDDLTAAQIADRVDELTASQLRKVRDYERRHGNRKSVLAAVEKRLQRA